MPEIENAVPVSAPETPEKKSGKERLKEITDSIEAGVKGVFESGKYENYLRTMSRLHRYSFNNTMLIYMQKPDATHVASFTKWKDEFKRHVKKGERGIKIIAPTPYKKKIETQKLDPDTHAPLLDKDGNAIMVEKEVQIPYFKVVSVFDISSTEGPPLPQLASTLKGDVKQYEAFLEALERSSPVPVSYENLTPGCDGVFREGEQSIGIQLGMSEVQTVAALIHEIAHSKLHNKKALEEAGVEVVEKTRRTQEVEAESVAYSVSQYYGIETSENSFGYIAGWASDRELSELKNSLETIRQTASGLITDIDRNFREVCKERGIEPDKAYQQEQESTPTIPESGAPSVSTELHCTEESFEAFSGDAYAIYQLRDDIPDYRALAYSNLEYLQKHGLSPGHANYDLKYVAPIEGNINLEGIYQKFNTNDRPTDFTGHSLSVSDIVAIKQDGHVSYHYCDSFGFRQLPDFRQQENYLKNAEMAMEDDYGMIDGIINNGKRNSPEEKNAPPAERESVLSKLKSIQPQEPNKTAPRKSAEREI